MIDSPFNILARTGGNPIIFRSQGSRIYSALGYLFCLGMFLTTIVDGTYTASENFAFSALTLLVAVSVYFGIQRPALLFTDVGLAIRNPFSTTVLDWNHVSEVNTKFVLNIKSHHGITKCWAAAGPSRSQHRAIHPSELKGFHQQSAGIRAADSPRSDSGAAAQIARGYIEKRGSVEASAINGEIKVNNLSKIFYAALAASVLVSHVIAYA
jgi:hypothetical protein